MIFYDHYAGKPQMNILNRWCSGDKESKNYVDKNDPFISNVQLLVTFSSTGLFNKFPKGFKFISSDVEINVIIGDNSTNELHNSNHILATWLQRQG